MNRPKTRNHYLLIFVISFSCTIAASDDSIYLHLPLESETRNIIDVNGKKVGLQFVSSIADQDSPEFTDVTRYRVKGRYGKGIRYFVDEAGYSKIDGGLAWNQPVETLAISLEVKLSKTKENRIAYLLGNMTSPDKAGFALYLYGHEVRFTFGDGKKQYDVRSSIQGLRDGKWHTLEVDFNRGTVAFLIDRVRSATQSVDTKTIAPSDRPLYIGRYPVFRKNYSHYPFDGWLDEIAIGASYEPLRNYLDEKNAGRNNQPLPPVIEYSAQPIDGNEPFFGSKKLLHTFRGKPVPLTFVFKSRNELIKNGESPSLVMYVPKNVKVASVYQSHHNDPEGVVATDVTTVQKNGKTWKRYETKGIDLTIGERNWLAGPSVSWAFDAGPDVKDANILYGMKYNGKEQELTEATLRFEDPPAAVPDNQRGRFHVFCYHSPSAFAYPDKAMWQPTADLLKSVGLTGKGRFYEHDNDRSAFDEFLKKQGFTLYEISLWNGPDVYKMALDPVGTTKEYVASRKDNLAPNGMNEGVLFDYEPWGVPYKHTSFTPEIRKVFAKWAGLKNVPDEKEIKNNYLRKWIDFWLHVSENSYSAMSEAVRTHHPDKNALRIAYTYIFPYDDEEELYNRFRAVPKDPRKAEQFYDVHLISFYTKNGRYLVDQYRLSRKNLRKPIWGISALSRVNPIQERYTTPETSLSPRRLEQKIVLCAALGMERHGLYPGRGWIDGKHLEAIGRACRFIWPREKFYFDGKNVRDDVVVVPPAETTPDDWACTAQQADGKMLVTIFNFTDKPITFNISSNKWKNVTPAACTVPPHGYVEKLYENIEEK